LLSWVRSQTALYNCSQQTHSVAGLAMMYNPKLNKEKKHFLTIDEVGRNNYKNERV